MSRLTVLFSQGEARINKSWILLDSQSPIDLFYNFELLTNIRKVNESVTVRCNVGNIFVNMIGDLPGYGAVCYYPIGITNILSLYLVSLWFDIQYSSRESGCFIVLKKDGTCLHFRPETWGSHYSDYDSTKETILLNDAIALNNDTVGINTVAKNSTQRRKSST